MSQVLDLEVDNSIVQRPNAENILIIVYIDRYLADNHFMPYTLFGSAKMIK